MIWSTTEALTAARYAQAAYSGDSRGCERIDVSDGNAAAAIFKRPDEPVVVALRGTDCPLDWWDNLHAWRRRCDRLPGSVHAGFCRQARQLLARLVGFIEPWHPVDVAGHSLGGALAPLVAISLGGWGYDVRAVHTFEAPRVADATFVGEYAAWRGPRRTWRVVNAIGRTVDLVTRVPKSSWGYWHVGRLALLHPGLRAPIHDPQVWEAYRAQQPVSPLRSVRVLMRLRRGRQAHSMSRVVEQLERMQAQERER